MLLIPQGGPAPDVWTIQLLDTQDINNPIVLDEATLTVDTRFTFLHFDPSATQLEQAGITVMQTQTIAAFFTSPAVGQLVLYGLTKHLERPAFTQGNPPIVIDSFGALAITPDLATAITEASDLSMAIIPGTTPPYPDSIKRSKQESLILTASLTDTAISGSTQEQPTTNQPFLTTPLDCVKQNDLCLDAAEARLSSNILLCGGGAFTAVSACALPSTGCFAGIGVCYVACVGALLVAEGLCIAAQNSNATADAIDCGSDYNVCCSENPCPPAE